MRLIATVLCVALLAACSGRPSQDDPPLTTRELRASFDDGMWLLSYGTPLDRARMGRFGVEIGEVILFFEKL
jgi:hypothetical protein